MRCKIPARDLEQKLGNSIIRYDGKPVFVRTDNQSLHLYTLPGGQDLIKVVKRDDPLIDISPIKLGYCNVRRGEILRACYITRTPWRRTKQGLTSSGIRLNHHQGVAPTGSTSTAIFGSKDFVEMLNNEYMAMEKVMTLLNNLYEKNKSYQEVAIHRNVAIGINDLGIIYVYYKGERVGWIQPGTTTVTIPSDNYGPIITKYLNGFNWVIK